MKREIGIKEEILDRAIRAVEQEVGLRMHVEQMDVDIGGIKVDGVVRLEPGDRTIAVEIKKWAQQANIGALISQVKRLPNEGLLVADYINPKMAGKLRQEGVQFIDGAGNAYINQTPVYIYVTGNRREEQGFMPTRDGAKRAFEPKGLMVLYAFLCDPDLINAPYREIAKRAGVALGTVGWVFNGLKAADLLYEENNNKKHRYFHYRKVLDRWVEAWPEKLKSKQLIGEFVAENPYWWKNVDIRKYNGYWSGEVAAAKYTNYLKPLVATLYLHDTDLKRLIVDERLKKRTAWIGDGAATILFYRAFWPEWADELNPEARAGLVHPILVYADLVATGEPRNLEVARRIYDEHIAQYCRED